MAIFEADCCWCRTSRRPRRCLMSTGCRGSWPFFAPLKRDKSRRWRPSGRRVLTIISGTISGYALILLGTVFEWECKNHARKRPVTDVHSSYTTTFENKNNFLEDHFKLEQRTKFPNGFSIRRCHCKRVIFRLVDAISLSGCVLQSHVFYLTTKT